MQISQLSREPPQKQYIIEWMQKTGKWMSEEMDNWLKEEIDNLMNEEVG